MKALVLAAGRGSRLGGASGGVPKPLVDAGGVTPLEHTLAWVAAFGVERIWINVHEGAAQVMERVGGSVGTVPVCFSHEPELLGTAGAWKKLEDEWTETALLVYGDNFMRFDLRALLHAHRGTGAMATIAIFNPDVHANTGIGGGRVLLEGDRVTDFVEGGDEHRLVNAGAYFLEPAVRERIPSGFSDFGRDILPGLAHSGVLAGHVVEDSGYCLGLDTPERLEIARRMLAAKEVTP